MIKIIENLAETGQKRRLFRENADRSQQMETGRLNRPVFLSYSNKDKQLATGFKRNLEARGISVWYAPAEVNVGEAWRNRIKDAVDQALIFIALITDHYVDSGACMGELIRFEKRIELGQKPQLLVLPVVNELSEDRRGSKVCRSMFEKYQYVDVSKRFTDGVTNLLLVIQTFLIQQGATVDSSRSSHSAA